MKNIILAVDSYKASHAECYPPNATAMESYIEARGGSHLFFFGLQMYIKEYLMTPITQAMINEADLFYSMHGEPFQRKMWEYILKEYNGYIPVVIKAVKEGTVLTNRNVVAKITCTDPNCFSVASHLETSLLRGIWYPSSVATYSYDCRQEIKRFMDITSDTPNDLAFKLHDFGGRGVSSGESAEIGGCAHLATGAMGSDTVEAIVRANRDYGCESGMAGYSIPATEHSTITSWGKENEAKAYKNFLDKFLKAGKMCACVSDSYDIMNACDIWGIELKEQIINSGGTLVVRPDSGDPASTVAAVIERLAEHFGTTTNSKGYKVLPSCIRVLQGDGITKGSIVDILSLLKFKHFSADNVAFGMGGQLLQITNRDSYGFAMKCCAIKVDGVWQDVFKEAPNKNSKKGQLELVKYADGTFETVREDSLKWEDKKIEGQRMLECAYLFPKDKFSIPWMRTQTLDEVRSLAK